MFEGMVMWAACHRSVVGPGGIILSWWDGEKWTKPPANVGRDKGTQVNMPVDPPMLKFGMLSHEDFPHDPPADQAAVFVSAGVGWQRIDTGGECMFYVDPVQLPPGTFTDPLPCPPAYEQNVPAGNIRIQTPPRTRGGHVVDMVGASTGYYHGAILPGPVLNIWLPAVWLWVDGRAVWVDGKPLDGIQYDLLMADQKVLRPLTVEDALAAWYDGTTFTTNQPNTTPAWIDAVAWRDRYHGDRWEMRVVIPNEHGGTWAKWLDPKVACADFGIGIEEGE